METFSTHTYFDSGWDPKYIVQAKCHLSGVLTYQASECRYQTG